MRTIEFVTVATTQVPSVLPVALLVLLPTIPLIALLWLGIEEIWCLYAKHQAIELR